MRDSVFEDEDSVSITFDGVLALAGHDHELITYVDGGPPAYDRIPLYRLTELAEQEVAS